MVGLVAWTCIILAMAPEPVMDDAFIDRSKSLPKP
jgi:hypothetical protein